MNRENGVLGSFIPLPPNGGRMSRRGAALAFASVLVLVTALSPLASAPPSGPEWVQKAPMPTARGYFGIAVLNGRIYVAGGLTESGTSKNVTGRVEMYNPDSDSWTQAADLRVPRWGPVLVSLGDVLVAAGGATNATALGNMTDMTELYNYVTDSWSPTVRMPMERIWAVGVAVNGTAQVWGGSPDGLNGTTSSVYAYDPGEIGPPTWQVWPSMPIAASNFQATPVGDLIVATGGWRNSPSTWSYRPATGAWETGSPMGTGRGNHAAADLGGYVFAIGGVTANTTECVPSRSVEAYDPASDTWTSLPDAPVAAQGFGAVRIGSTLYAVGGAGCGMSSSALYALTLSTPVTPSTPSLDALAIVAAFAGVALLVRGWGRRRPPEP